MNIKMRFLSFNSTFKLTGRLLRIRLLLIKNINAIYSCNNIHDATFNSDYIPFQTTSAGENINVSSTYAQCNICMKSIVTRRKSEVASIDRDNSIAINGIIGCIYNKVPIINYNPSYRFQSFKR